MTAQAFRYPHPPLTDLGAMVAVVRRELESLPGRRSAGIDFYFRAALERRRMRLCAAGAAITLSPSEVCLAWGGRVAKGRDLGEAMHEWLACIAREDFEEGRRG